MVKNKIENITKFLNSWDREVYNLNIKLKKMNQKQKKDELILQKKENHTFRSHK